MPLKLWNGSAWSTATSVKIWNGSIWAPAKFGRIWDGSEWKDFLNNLLAGGGSQLFPGSKGVEQRTQTWRGYSDGTGSGIDSSAYGSFYGQLLNHNVNVFRWEGVDYEFSADTGIWKIELTGNIPISARIEINNTVITNFKSGTVSGGKTIWSWDSTLGDTVTYVGANSPFNIGSSYYVQLVPEIPL